MGSKREILPDQRRAGVCLHLTALPGRYGIGEIGAQARRFIDRMRRMQLGVWQFLPTGPTGYGDSPYAPLSTFAGNEMLVDIGDLVSRRLLKAAEVAALKRLPVGHVDYGALIPVKNRLLGIAAARFLEKPSRARKAAYEDFLDRHDAAWLHDYALFRILKSRHGERAWPEWQAEYVHREPAALRRLERSAAAEIAGIKVTQFLFHDQWHRLKAYARKNDVLLFGDMPIYIAFDSADAWANRDILELNGDGRAGHVAGVPPDYFSEDGQLWGNPLYDWDMHAKTGYRWWIERLRASAELADIVRVDHFRGFEGYWAVPAEADTARDGSWEPGPGDAIFAAMREALGALPIVAEDLGVITPEVDALRRRHEIPGMVVLQFDVCNPDFDIDDVGENSVCYTGTHDNDTTVGWFHGSPNDIRPEAEIEATRKAALALTGGTPETIHTDLIRAAFSTAARLAIAPMQDFLGLGSEARFNTPGKSADNWRWRLGPGQLTDELSREIAAMVIASGRGHAVAPRTKIAG